jgi:hypothetical protein
VGGRKEEGWWISGGGVVNVRRGGVDVRKRWGGYKKEMV